MKHSTKIKLFATAGVVKLLILAFAWEQTDPKKIVVADPTPQSITEESRKLVSGTENTFTPAAQAAPHPRFETDAQREAKKAASARSQWEWLGENVFFIEGITVTQKLESFQSLLETTRCQPAGVTAEDGFIDFIGKDTDLVFCFPGTANTEGLTIYKLKPMG